MNLQEKISSDMVIAMRNKDINKRDLLRVIIGEVNRYNPKNKVFEFYPSGSIIVPDGEVMIILKKMRDDAIFMNNPHEVVILEEYLPKAITKEELTDFIKKVIKDNSLVDMKGMGKVISELKTKYGTNYDGKLASDIYKENI